MGDQEGVDLLSFLSPEHPGDRSFQVEAIQLVDGGREVFHPFLYPGSSIPEISKYFTPERE